MPSSNGGPNHGGSAAGSPRYEGFTSGGRRNVLANAEKAGQNGNIPELDGADLQLLEVNVKARIGGGASGRVYRCVYRGQQLAIKVVHPNLCRRADTLQSFLKEANMMFKCEHRHIVKGIAICQVPPMFCGLPTRRFTWALLMELMEEGNMAELIRAQKTEACPRTYSDAEALGWCLALAKALEYLHNQTSPVVHRDIKPENILLSCASSTGVQDVVPEPASLTVKLSDFGIHVVLDSTRPVLGLRQRSSSFASVHSAAAASLHGGILPNNLSGSNCGPVSRQGSVRTSSTAGAQHISPDVHSDGSGHLVGSRATSENGPLCRLVSSLDGVQRRNSSANQNMHYRSKLSRSGLPTDHEGSHLSTVAVQPPAPANVTDTHSTRRFASSPGVEHGPSSDLASTSARTPTGPSRLCGESPVHVKSPRNSPPSKSALTPVRDALSKSRLGSDESQSEMDNHLMPPISHSQDCPLPACQQQVFGEPSRSLSEQISMGRLGSLPTTTLGTRLSGDNRVIPLLLSHSRNADEEQKSDHLIGSMGYRGSNTLPPKGLGRPSKSSSRRSRLSSSFSRTSDDCEIKGDDLATAAAFDPKEVTIEQLDMTEIMQNLGSQSLGSLRPASTPTDQLAGRLSRFSKPQVEQLPTPTLGDDLQRAQRESPVRESPFLRFGKRSQEEGVTQRQTSGRTTSTHSSPLSATRQLSQMSSPSSRSLRVSSLHRRLSESTSANTMPAVLGPSLGSSQSCLVRGREDLRLRHGSATASRLGPQTSSQNSGEASPVWESNYQGDSRLYRRRSHSVGPNSSMRKMRKSSVPPLPARSDGSNAASGGANELPTKELSASLPNRPKHASEGRMYSSAATSLLAAFSRAGVVVEDGQLQAVLAASNTTSIPATRTSYTPSQLISPRRGEALAPQKTAGSDAESEVTASNCSFTSARSATSRRYPSGHHVSFRAEDSRCSIASQMTEGWAPDDSFEPVYDLTGRQGTTLYMAPEIINKEPYNEKCDVFSFGVVMLELYTRSLLKDTYTPEELEKLGFHSAPHHRQFLSDKLKKPGGLHTGVWNIITMCLQKDPGARPSMAQVVVLLLSVKGAATVKLETVFSDDREEAGNRSLEHFIKSFSSKTAKPEFEVEDSPLHTLGEESFQQHTSRTGNLITGREEDQEQPKGCGPCGCVIA